MTISNFDATTPQLKAVKNLLEAYHTLDVSKVEPFVAKGFRFQTWPETEELPEEQKDGHIERYGQLFSLMSSADFNVHEVIEAQGKVVVHFTAVFTTKVEGEGPIEYDTLSIFTLVEEDGELKVCNFKDISHPGKRENFHDYGAQKNA